MAYNTKELKKDSKGNPIPQQYDPVTDDYVVLTKKDFYGNSTDIKPTTAEKGSTYYEFDTGNAYIFTGSAWVVL